MSNGEGRKTHVKRVYQDDDDQSDTWVDVSRIDELNVIVAGTQKVHYKFDWTEIESGGGDPDKKTISEPDNPDNTIDIPIRQSVRLVGGGAVRNHYFLNDESNHSRVVHTRRIYHHAAKDGYDEKNLPTDPQQYKDSLGDQDVNQYIDVEVIDAYYLKGDTPTDVYGHAGRVFRGVEDGEAGARGQVRKWHPGTSDPLMSEPLLEGDVKGGGAESEHPVRLDPLQNIVNVQWGGVAVELSRGGREVYKENLDLDKATISLWFRYSAEAASKAEADANARLSAGSGFQSDRVYAGVLPIIGWGPTTTARGLGETGETVSWTEGPSFIGVQYYPDADVWSAGPYLVLRFQSNKAAAVIDSSAGVIGRSGGEFFQVGLQGSGFQYSTDLSKPIPVGPSKWHHLLASWNVPGTTGDLWIKLDGKTYDASGGYFFPAGKASMGLFGISGSSSDIVANYAAAGIIGDDVTIVSAGFSMPHDSFAIPTDKTKYITEPIAVADLQIFLDESGDFDHKLFVNDNGKPEDPAKAEEFFGKRPEILLRGVSNWKQGFNTGSAGVDDEGNKREGQFSTAPTIKGFTPGPKIGA